MPAPWSNRWFGSGPSGKHGGRDWQVVSGPVGNPAVLGLHPGADGALAVATQRGTFAYRLGSTHG